MSRDILFDWTPDPVIINLPDPVVRTIELETMEHGGAGDNVLVGQAPLIGNGTINNPYMSGTEVKTLADIADIEVATDIVV